MGGFKFGSVGHLDIDVSIISFVCVIVFVVFFDAMTGVLEYFLDGSKLYNRMVQLIYKELMLMGLVSFTIIMSGAFQTTAQANSNTAHTWLAAVDFAHILLFFLTFFFVAHACYLMRKSMLSSFKYHGIMGEPTADLISAVENCSKDSFGRFLYQLNYLPLSNLKDRVELRFVNTLFRDTYWLPDEFDFSAYLSGCFDRFALKAINRSPITWLILIFLAFINYIRNRLGIGFQSCENSATATVNHQNSTTGTDDYSSNSILSGGGYDNEQCRINLVQFFLFCGALLVIYTFLIVFISRTYKLRMLQRIGLSTTDDYYKFLQFLHDEEEEHNINKTGQKLTNEDLKRDIEKVLDEDEHSDETEEFKDIAEALVKFKDMIKDIIHSIELNLRFLMSSFRVTSQTSKATKNIASVTPLLAAFQNVPHSEVRAAESTTPNDKGQRHQTLVSLFKQPSRLTMSNTSNGMGPSSNSQEAALLLRRISTRPSNAHVNNVPTLSQLPNNNLQKIDEENCSTADADSEKKLQAPKSSFGPEIGHDLHTRESEATNSPRITQNIDERPSIVKLLQKMEFPSNSSKELGIRKTILISNHHNTNNADHPGSIPSSDPAPLKKDMYRKNHDALQQSVHTTILVANHGPTSPNNNTNVERRPRRNSVTVKPPENVLSTIDKFKLHKIEQAMKNPTNKTHQQQNTKNVTTTNFFHSLTIPFLWCFSLTNMRSTSSKVAQDVETGKPLRESLESIHLNEDFGEIYIFGEPIYFFRAVEVCILFNCLYMGFWMTDFIAICLTIKQSSVKQIIFQLLMIIPVIIVLPLVGYIAETCSMLNAISELNVEVLFEVLVEQEDTNNLLKDLRSKMIERINALESSAQDNVKIVRALFDEIDGDGNGWIDRLEFRFLLRTLKLTYSDDRFNRLYRAVDTSGDGKIVWDELYELLFGGLIKESAGDSNEKPPKSNANHISSSDLHPSLFSSNSAKQRMVNLANLARQDENDDEDEDSSNYDVSEDSADDCVQNIEEVDAGPST